jgi:hypothetical protein
VFDCVLVETEIQEGNVSDEGSQILDIQTVSTPEDACTGMVDSVAPGE